MPLNAVLKFKMLAPQSLCGLPLDATEALARDRMTWLCFCGLELKDTVPDANTLLDFRETPIDAGSLDFQIQESVDKTELPPAVGEAAADPNLAWGIPKSVQNWSKSDPDRPVIPLRLRSQAIPYEIRWLSEAST